MAATLSFRALLRSRASLHLFPMSRHASSTAAWPDRLRRADLLRNQAYIGGQWVGAKDGATHEVIGMRATARPPPARVAMVMLTACCDAAMLQIHPLGARCGACQTWGLLKWSAPWRRHIVPRRSGRSTLLMSVLPAPAAAAARDHLSRCQERSAIVSRISELLQQHQEDLAIIMAVEGGKPLAEAKGEVAYSAGFFRWFAEEIKRAYGDVIPTNVATRRCAAPALLSAAAAQHHAPLRTGAAC